VPVSVFLQDRRDYNFFISFSGRHTRKIGGCGILDRWLQTPRTTRVTRQNDITWTRITGSFLIWDRLLGTFKRERAMSRCIYGVRGQGFFDRLEPRVGPTYITGLRRRTAGDANRWLDNASLDCAPGWRTRMWPRVSRKTEVRPTSTSDATIRRQSRVVGIVPFSSWRSWRANSHFWRSWRKGQVWEWCLFQFH